MYSILIIGLLYSAQYVFVEAQMAYDAGSMGIDPSHPYYAMMMNASPQEREMYYQLLGLAPDAGGPGGQDGPEFSPEMLFPQIPSFEPPPNITDEMLDAAQVVNKGMYEQTRFDFQNHQNMQPDRVEEGDDYASDKCITQYMKCLMSQTRPFPVCAYNKGGKYKDNWRFYMSANSYCDVYFDNCRRGYRAWRIIIDGICKVGKGENVIDANSETRRLYSKYLFIRKIMGVGSQN